MCPLKPPRRYPYEPPGLEIANSVALSKVKLAELDAAMKELTEEMVGSEMIYDVIALVQVKREKRRGGGGCVCIGPKENGGGWRAVSLVLCKVAGKRQQSVPSSLFRAISL